MNPPLNSLRVAYPAPDVELTLDLHRQVATPVHPVDTIACAGPRAHVHVIRAQRGKTWQLRDDALRLFRIGKFVRLGGRGRGGRVGGRSDRSRRRLGRDCSGGSGRFVLRTSADGLGRAAAPPGSLPLSKRRPFARVSWERQTAPPAPDRGEIRRVPAMCRMAIGPRPCSRLPPEATPIRKGPKWDAACIIPAKLPGIGSSSRMRDGLNRDDLSSSNSGEERRDPGDFHTPPTTLRRPEPRPAVQPRRRSSRTPISAHASRSVSKPATPRARTRASLPASDKPDQSWQSA